MKNLIVVISLAFLVACAGGEGKSIDSLIEEGNLEALQEKKAELNAQLREQQAQMKQIETYIASKDSTKKLPLVSLYKIESQNFSHFVELQGSVETDQNIVVYPEYSGTLLSFKVGMGDKVLKGQTVAVIDDGGLRKQLAQVEQMAKLSKTTYEKRKRLWDQKIGSEMEYLGSETQYLADIEMVNQIQEQVAKTVVTAPFTGIIDETIADEGQIVSPGATPLFRIVNLSNMFIKADVPEKYLSSIKKGRMVKVDLPILDTIIETSIEKVSNYINPANRTYRVEVSVPNKDGMIKPNLTAKLMINDYRNQQAILIPQSIISENSEGKQYVYRTASNNDNTAVVHKAFIETGVKQGDFIEVLSGLDINDAVVQEGARTVKDNQEVEIIK
ncbi:efflux RND transporter periplasmic adaptor subunit [Vicingaceae bacterium]|nr:efflux RND transporter periplasmic adaptor subunit [Vicingaceae bacterium]MDC0004767.1 efflux RND transporter periplasmic adaptor subunit [bacterium]MDC1450958.1 efflux RND transporter periplasmic adaptor subunit [Vicingaceae bacterium]